MAPITGPLHRIRAGSTALPKWGPREPRKRPPGPPEVMWGADSGSRPNGCLQEGPRTPRPSPGPLQCWSEKAQKRNAGQDHNHSSAPRVQPHQPPPHPAPAGQCPPRHESAFFKWARILALGVVPKNGFQNLATWCKRPVGIPGQSPNIPPRGPLSRYQCGALLFRAPPWAMPAFQLGKNAPRPPSPRTQLVPHRSLEARGEGGERVP
ncbi:WAS/WASL-interacting protein family member 1-like [Penaeus monodon]|uniref:WAS/WASL-interacting protein family member 1-like n=1 Tax=Penaeus monodon TaxID=6687 RepID=UPI0018A73F10|nr:WAS/WASL-interacting protein family member 1-like [Penaeus monodon]